MSDHSHLDTGWVDDAADHVIRTVLIHLQARGGFNNWWFTIPADLEREIRSDLRDGIAGSLLVNGLAPCPQPAEGAICPACGGPSE